MFAEQKSSLHNEEGMLITKFLFLQHPERAKQSKSDS